MSWDAVELQILLGALEAACDEMGATLTRAAHSPNIKERRDCSSAIFNRSAALVMQAEHIPVHLGSMPDAVAAVTEFEQRPGETWIHNDPYRGGTHLPDITLISPVFAEGELIGFVANRAHHADVGADTPGSMPANSTRLSQEGVVIKPSRLDQDLLEQLVGKMREPDQRRADLRAQQAANRIGATRMVELAERYGRTDLAAGMEAILGYSERRARAALAAIADGTAEGEDFLEPGPMDGVDKIPLRLRAELRGDRLMLDFSGSADQVKGNLNCPLSVTRSAALFAVRALTDPDAPPSAGAHRPVEISAPAGCLLNARPPAAVAAGNVETSSRVADLVISVLGELMPAPAQGQGTMNNLTLASLPTAAREWTYYETLAGGQGAAHDAPGPDAIHVAMSNTRNTPVEALESEYPLRVRRLEIRRGSGGRGRLRGGDGLVREIEALEPIQFSLISERRLRCPAGSSGGGDGATGRNLLNGEPLPAKVEGRMSAGDVLRIETPGGGGFGVPADAE